ncbi:TauD/TfdA family dioxygenase [Paucibacter sp. APW11]|uniref:TauD/TfdA family dioxygenase n=2 Tax=Roseateles aquae TaxID=3077235 RepID=A0ABU3PBU3_9BURK|nr:TauD/TfdA family dioxygenase [Paucibacter sp. APW11]
MRILQAVASHHRHAAWYQQISRTDDLHLQAMLGDDLRSVAPGLARLAERLKAEMAAAGCGVLVPSLGLAGLDAQTRARLVYALCACIGRPTATDFRKSQLIWDVQNRTPLASSAQLAGVESPAYYATFSEHDREADYHSDTQYYPMPERMVLLYVMEAADCGGGVSRVSDARALRTELDQATTAWAYRALSERPLPFRVPDAFRTSDSPDAVQATLAPVFASEPAIRYRRDTLRSGVALFPEHADDEQRAALEVFEAALARSTRVAEFALPRDSLLLLDNHQALHARSAFSDAGRHLLRIRLRGDEPEHGQAPYRLIERRIGSPAVPASSLA